MAETGVIVFGALTGLMVICAGGAAAPPTRDIRVFIGACVFAGAWTIITVFINRAERFDVSSTYFLLDIFYLVAFYFLSSPSEKDSPHAVYERNWAGYIVGVFTLIIGLELTHFLLKSDYWFELALGLFSVGIVGIVGYGFARGFGPIPTLSFLGVIGAFLLLANYAYVLSVNVLTLAVMLIILIRAFRGTKRNIESWLTALNKTHKRDDSSTKCSEQEMMTNM